MGGVVHQRRAEGHGHDEGQPRHHESLGVAHKSIASEVLYVQEVILQNLTKLLGCTVISLRITLYLFDAIFILLY